MQQHSFFARPVAVPAFPRMKGTLRVQINHEPRPSWTTLDRSLSMLSGASCPSSSPNRDIYCIYIFNNVNEPTPYLLINIQFYTNAYIYICKKERDIYIYVQRYRLRNPPCRVILAGYWSSARGRLVAAGARLLHSLSPCALIGQGSLSPPLLLVIAHTFLSGPVAVPTLQVAFVYVSGRTVLPAPGFDPC